MTLKPSLGISMHVTGVPRYFTSDYVQGVAHLRTISGIVHEHHPCGGKQGNLPGSCLSTIFKFASIQVSDTPISDGYLHIFWTKESN